MKYSEAYLRMLVGFTRVTSIVVFEAVIEHLTSGARQKELAAKYGVSQSVICRLKGRLLKLDKQIMKIAKLRSLDGPTDEYLRELVQLSKATSTPVLNAAIEYMLQGGNQGSLAAKFNIDRSEVSRRYNRLLEFDERVTCLIKLRNYEQQ